MIVTKKKWFVLVQGLTSSRWLAMNVWALIVLGCQVHWHKVPPAWFWVTLALMILAHLTDLFDGNLARRHQVVSRLGKYGDPFMDAVSIGCVLPVLTLSAAWQGQLWHSAILALLTSWHMQRDHLTSNLRSIGSLHQIDAGAGRSGKVRTVYNDVMVCIVYCYLAAPNTSLMSGFPTALVYALEIGSIGLTVFTAVVYTRRFWPAVRNEVDHALR